MSKFLSKIGDFVESKVPQISKLGNLSEDDIQKALKEALQKGIETAVSQVSVDNGYYRDQAIRILLPPEAQMITSNISKLPHGDELVDNCVKNINAAASDAAKDVTPIFIDAIKSMNIQDAKNILLGEERAATNYFKGKTDQRLRGLIEPKINNSMNKKIVGDCSAASSWSSLMSQWNKLAGSSVGKIAGLKVVDTDITSYVTGKAMDGLFSKIGDQEKEIRSNVNAQTTELLRKVFGSVMK